MAVEQLVFRVVDWDQRYETPRTLKQNGTLSEVPVSANLGRVVFQKLLKLPGSAEVLGVWYVLQLLAANCERRGVFSDRGAALSSDDLARVCGWDVSVVERSLRALCSPEIQLLERVPLEVALRPPVIPEPPLRKPRKPKPPPFTHCPVCNADLVALAEIEATHCDAGCSNAIHGDALPHSACSNPIHRVAQPQRTVEENGKECPMDSTIPEFSDKSQSVELQGISELRRRFERGEVSPEVVDQYLRRYYAREATKHVEPTACESSPSKPHLGEPAASTANYRSVLTRTSFYLF